MTDTDVDYDDDPPPYRPPLTLAHATAVLDRDGSDSSGYAQAIATLSIARSLDRLVELLEQRHVADLVPERAAAVKRTAQAPDPDEKVVVTCSAGRPDGIVMTRAEAERTIAVGIDCKGEHRIVPVVPFAAPLYP